MAQHSISVQSRVLNVDWNPPTIVEPLDSLKSPANVAFEIVQFVKSPAVDHLTRSGSWAYPSESAEVEPQATRINCGMATIMPLLNGGALGIGTQVWFPLSGGQ